MRIINAYEKEEAKKNEKESAKAERKGGKTFTKE
jgi:hypothetical protein